MNSLICLRWKFMVNDPAGVRDLKLTLTYVGGVVVHLNGQELARAHLPAGEIKPETEAEKYPDDLHCEPDGNYLQDPRKNPAGFERRYRELAGVAVPADLLRKGANVLAVEVHRAPINEGAINAKHFARPGDGMYTVPGLWAYAGLKSISLAAAPGAGAVPNLARPRGVQVWNVPSFGTITANDYGDPGEALPVKVAAARNSVFSGRLAVSSDQPIRGLKAAVSDLKLAGAEGSLPASAVTVRYAEPAVPAKCWTPPGRFNGLVETIPAEIPVTGKGADAGAVASLWFTARVPRDAKAGRHEGTITLQAQGLQPTTVPLHLAVSDWVMPDPADFRQHHLIFLSQEAVAKHYEVPLWSDRHFELMGKSMKLLAEVNSREVPANLGTDFYGSMGNEDTLVRWIREGDGYRYDFTLFDKYLDLVATHFGKPFPLRLNCWGEVGRDGKNSCVKAVSLLDPATGKTEPLEQPLFGTEESFAFWKPVIEECLRKVKDRGWLEVTALGHNSYCYNPKAEVISLAKRIWPDGVWAYTAHNGVLGGSWKGTGDETMPVKYSVCIWTEGRLRVRGYSALFKPRPGLWCNTARTRHRDWSPLITIRNLPEEVIQRGMDGLGDFGGDLFPIRNPKNNRFYCLGNGRGTGGPNDAERAILAPGPDGAVATERFEVFREGTELTEAILYLEKALQDKKIGGELAARADRYLTERSEVFIRYWYERRSGAWDASYRWTPPGLVARDAELLEICGQAAGAAR